MLLTGGWMKNNAQCPFERYADDIVIHCVSREEAERILQLLHNRMAEYELALHPEKTRIVFCKNYSRKGKHDAESFQPRTIRSKRNIGERFVVFMAGICSRAKKYIKDGLRNILRPQWTNMTLEWFAEKLNPKIRGWINYYTKYSKYETYQVFYYLNTLIRSWIKNKYRINSKAKMYDKYRVIQQAAPDLFYHWQKGILT